MNRKKVRIIAFVLLAVLILYNGFFVVYNYMDDADINSKFTVEINPDLDIVIEDVTEDNSNDHPPGYCETDEDCVFAELECKDNICQFRER